MQKTTKNALIVSTIIASAIAIITFTSSKLLSFKRFVNFNITGIKKADIYGANLLQIPPNLGALRLIFDIAVDNGSNNEYSITVPFIRAYINDSFLGNSIPQPERILIKKSQRTTIANIDFRIPVMNLKLLGISSATVQSMIASRTFRLNRTVKFVVGLNIDGATSEVEIPVNI